MHENDSSLNELTSPRMSCIFCSIIERTAPAEIIYENEGAIAFLDIKPIHPGHALVVPKKHYERTIEIPDDELFFITKASNSVASAMMRTLKPDGYNIFTSNGRAAGQAVFHVHYHVTPRYYNDGIHFHLQLKSYRKNEMKMIADKIRLCSLK